jgi:hypothetical protein
MVPRTVVMAKAVADIIGEGPVSEYGNIVAKPYMGWSNIYSGYFLGSPGSIVNDTLGRPVTFSYYVHSWLAKQPRWAQPSRRIFGNGFSAILSPVADSPVPPPLNSVVS